MNTIDLVIAALSTGILAWGLSRYAPKAVPMAGLTAQGILGVTTGMMLETFSFSALGSSWPIVVAVALGTLLISVIGGALLGLHREVTPLTGALSLVAGGASGVVAIARELGGDDRVVAAIQYLRVALITAAMPVIVAVIYHGAGTHVTHTTGKAAFTWYFSMLVVALIIVVGVAAGRLVRLPGAGLLGPLAITIALELSGFAERLDVPTMVVEAGFMIIVWQSVLGLNRESLRAIRRILPGALALIFVLNVAAAGLGVLLAHVARLSTLDGYLATSPGGIYAVLGTAEGSGSNVTIVMATQVLRVVVMLFAAPFIARLFMRLTPPQSAAITLDNVPTIPATRSASTELVSATA